MRYLETETARKITLLHLSAKETALALAPRVFDLVNQWEGKQLNKRFDTALKAIDSGLTYDTKYGAFHIVWYIPQDRRYIRTKTDKNGVCTGTYITQYEIDLCGYLELVNARNLEKCATIENRINAAPIVATIKQTMTDRAAGIEKTRAQLENVEELRKRHDELKAAVEQYANDLDYLVSDYFDLALRIDHR